MAEMRMVAAKVRQHWLSQGLRVSPVLQAAFDELQRSCSEGLPEDYGTFLRVAGLPDDEDREGVRFWPPAEVRSTYEVLRAAKYLNATPSPSVIIADYLQESWWFCLWVGGPFRGQVSLVLGRGSDPQPPMGTLAEFLDAYLRDDPQLYPGDVDDRA